MKKDPKHIRRLAVKKYLKGESASAICASFGKSRFWLYKWVKRFNPNNPTWCQEYSRRPNNTPHRTPLEIEEIVKMIRLNLYNNDLFYGAQAICWEMEDLGVSPLPSERTINRILARNDLTHRRTGRYERDTLSRIALWKAKSNPSSGLSGATFSTRSYPILQSERR